MICYEKNPKEGQTTLNDYLQSLSESEYVVLWVAVYDVSKYWKKIEFPTWWPEELKKPPLFHEGQAIIIDTTTKQHSIRNGQNAIVEMTVNDKKYNAISIGWKNPSNYGGAIIRSADQAWLIDSDGLNVMIFDRNNGSLYELFNVDLSKDPGLVINKPSISIINSNQYQAIVDNPKNQESHTIEELRFNIIQDKNDILSIVKLAQAYRDGRGTAKNLSKSAEYYRTLINKGEISVSNEFFDLIWKTDDEKLYNEGFKIVLSYANEGNGEAIGRVARSYRDGRGVDKNYEESKKWYIKAIEKGIKWARYELFNLMWVEGKPEDENEMAKLVINTASKGDLASMHLLGRCYLDGRGVKKDTNKAAEIIEESYSRGYWRSVYDLINILKKIGSVESISRMLRYIRERVEVNDAHAMALLGMCYFEGVGVTQDKTNAIRWLEKSRDCGYSRANDLLVNRVNSECVTEPQTFPTELSLIKTIDEGHDDDCYVYSITHPGFMLNIINLRYVLHPSEKAILFVSSEILEKDLEKLVKNKVFDKIVRYSTTVGSYKSIFQSVNGIEYHFDMLLKSAGISISKIKTAYLLNDNYEMFGSYLYLKGVKTIVCEPFIDSNYMKTINVDWLHDRGSLTDDAYWLQRDARILRAEGLSERIALNNNRKYDANNFDNTHAPELISKENREKVIKSFDDIREYNGGTIIALSRIGLKALPKEECRIFSQILVNYYTSGAPHIIIKTHPKFGKSLGKHFISDSISVMPMNVNIDLIAFYDDIKMANFITFSISAFEKIEDYSERSVLLDTKMYRYYRFLPTIELLFTLFEQHGLTIHQTIIDENDWKSCRLFRICNNDQFDAVICEKEPEMGEKIVITPNKLDLASKDCNKFQVDIESDLGKITDLFYIYSTGDAVTKILSSESTFEFGNLKLKITNK